MLLPAKTIAALATPAGRGGVAVIRISGELASSIAKIILGKMPSPRYAKYADFLDEKEEIIDSGIAIFFPKPHSFTGEDVLELQSHGGPVVVERLLQRLLSLGVHLARPGEFSERAFLNNKIDLVQAEAVADLIDAVSEQAARSAIKSLQGEFSKHIHALVDSIIHLRMYVEAAIDFPEEDIDFLADERVIVTLSSLIKKLIETEQSATQGCLLRDGITLVIVGLPNAGKSSLLNWLSGKETAIVTDIPGTTRDILRESIHIDGMPIHILDTAGLRQSHDVIEQEGIRRAKEEIARADLILYVTDASQPEIIPLENFPENIPVIIIKNKIDLLKKIPLENNGAIALSIKKNIGMELLKNKIKMCVGFHNENEGLFSARRRHLDALSRAKVFLLHGQTQLTLHRAGELLAEDLRQAQLALNEITGEFTSDDLFGKIFSSFCVGK